MLGGSIILEVVMPSTKTTVTLCRLEGTNLTIVGILTKGSHASLELNANLLKGVSTVTPLLMESMPATSSKRKRVSAD